MIVLVGTIVLSSFIMANAAEPRIEVTSLVHPVTVGGLIVIKCEIWNIQGDFIVSMFRVYNDDTVHITNGDIYMTTRRMFLTNRSMNGGVHVFLWTIPDVMQNDKGSYLCRISRLLRGSYVDIAEDSTNIEMYTFPSDPSCESEPTQPVILSENNLLKLTCTSDKSFPTVELKWSCNNPQVRLSPRNTTRGGVVSSEISLFTETAHHGMVCICKLSSRGFPDRERDCRIGPITILGPPKLESEDRISPTLASDDNSGNQQTILRSANCDETECSSETTILYLIMSTTGASIMCVTFLTTTIIWCCKYQNIANEITNAQCVTSGYGDDHLMEPVYVSLQTRSACPPREYMTVDDPNNPENKVVMPKEVFDEFYRTLSVKRV